MKANKKAFQKFLDNVLSKTHLNKMNGWVRLAELPNGVSVCRHIKKDYIAHFYLN